MRLIAMMAILCSGTSVYAKIETPRYVHGVSGIEEMNILSTSPYEVVVPLLNADPATGDRVAGQIYYNIGTGGFKAIDSTGTVVDLGSSTSNLPPEITVDGTTGSHSYTVPTGARWLKVTVVGAGGGGGGTNSTAGTSGAGAGGGAGATVVKTITNPTGPYSYTVGTGGNGGTAGTNDGSSGGTSSFSTLTANGGAGGRGATSSSAPTGVYGNGTQGIGGTGSGGDYSITGNAGLPGLILSSSQAIPGVGGASLLGATNIPGQTGAGTAGISYGSGGNGALQINNSGAVAGGRGSDGVVIVEAYY